MIMIIMQHECFAFTKLSHFAPQAYNLPKHLVKGIDVSKVTNKVSHLKDLRMNQNIFLIHDQASTSTTSLSSKRSSRAEKEEPSPKSNGESIISLAVPALISLAIDPLLTLADTAFIGQFAPSSALAGVGSASALLTFAFYLFNFLSISTTPLVSTKRASGDIEGAVETGGQSLSLAIVLGSILAIVLSLLSSECLGIIMGNDVLENVTNEGTATALGGKQEAFGYGLSFLSIRALAAPAVLICNSSVGILRGFLDTKTPIFILLGANIINFSLDCFLIPGLGMGSTGAAIATTTAEWISAISFLCVLSGNLPSLSGDLGKKKIENDNSKLESPEILISPTSSIPEWNEIKPLILASSSNFFRSAAIQITLSGAAAMAARGGLSSSTMSAVMNESSTITTAVSSTLSATAAAAHQIAIQLWLLTSFVCDALAAASQTLIADAIGRNDAKGVRELSKTVLVYSVYLGIALAGLLCIGSYTGDHPFLLSFFTPDEEIQNALIPILGWVIISQPLNSFVFTTDGILQGAAEFSFQAKSVILSAVFAIASFVGLEYFNVGQGNLNTFLWQETSSNILPLIHVWEALVILIFMRGLTSAVKLIDDQGPIDIFDMKS